MSVFVVVALHAPGVETDMWMVDKADHEMEHMRGHWSVSGMPTLQVLNARGTFDSTRSNDEFDLREGRVPQFVDIRHSPTSLKIVLSCRPSAFVLSLMFHSWFLALKSPVTTTGLWSTISCNTETAAVKDEI